MPQGNFLNTYQQKSNYTCLFQLIDNQLIMMGRLKNVDNFLILWKRLFDFDQSLFCIKML
tara:strand:+ start:484369 stop:484548 length:180 start_codon:yes stop_codon:yes gene_type:complete